jgi:hypothetical protein
MRIPTWRLGLTAGAVVILVAAGIGLVAAAGAGAPGPSDASVVLADATAGPSSTARADKATSGGRLAKRAALAARLLRVGRHLVHIEATLTDRDGRLVTVWLDHGTVQSVGGGSLTIAEAGGGTKTVKTDDATVVRLGRGDGSLSDLKVGAEVFVQSRVDGGNPLAKRIRIIPEQAG